MRAGQECRGQLAAARPRYKVHEPEYFGLTQLGARQFGTCYAPAWSWMQSTKLQCYVIEKLTIHEGTRASNAI